MLDKLPPLPPPCGQCRWRCRECGQSWTCEAEGLCRGPGLEVCPPCWLVASAQFFDLGENLLPPDDDAQPQPFHLVWRDMADLADLPENHLAG